MTVRPLSALTLVRPAERLPTEHGPEHGPEHRQRGTPAHPVPPRAPGPPRTPGSTGTPSSGAAIAGAPVEDGSPGRGPAPEAAPGREPAPSLRTLSSEDRALLEQMVPALGTALVEVLVGLRPAHAVERWIEPALYGRIREHVAVRTSLTRYSGQTPETRALARSHRLSPVSETVAEASVVVRTRNRARALAMRFERTRARWRLTEFLSV